MLYDLSEILIRMSKELHKEALFNKDALKLNSETEWILKSFIDKNQEFYDRFFSRDHQKHEIEVDSVFNQWEHILVYLLPLPVHISLDAPDILHFLLKICLQSSELSKHKLNDGLLSLYDCYELRP